jgi:propanediol utilization protein
MTQRLINNRKYPDVKITLTGDLSGTGSPIINTTINAGVVGISNLSATGTPSSTTYLRGDNTWATISGGTGTVTSIGTSAPLTGGTITTSGTIGITQATTSTDGYLSSIDWSTFNSKESALTFSTGLTRTTNTITANLSTGVSGGQTVVGGTASGNNLTLSSTLHATKGKILFGNSAYDEVNNRLGIGTTTPQATLQVLTTVTDIAGRFSTNQSNRFLIMSGSTHNALVAFGKEGISTLWAIGNEHSTGDTLKITPRGDLLGTASLGILKSNSNIGLSVITPTATLHIRAGTAIAGSAPIKLTAGTNLTTAEAGVIEYNNTFHLTNSDATRRHVVTAPNTTKVTAAAPYTNDGYIIVNIGGIDFKLMTTA